MTDDAPAPYPVWHLCPGCGTELHEEAEACPRCEWVATVGNP